MGHPTSWKQPKRSGWPVPLILLGILASLGLIWRPNLRPGRFFPRTPPGNIAPLAMSGGNPYVRALMRTISASEANDPSPYTLLYGGSHVQNLSQHPDRCMRIRVGPNRGDCTTAAGRYQFLTTTWIEKANLYHPRPPQFWLWGSYSFEPEDQDRVVYAWLSDPQSWGGVDIPALLEAGELDQVLQLLSGTWTSLGYGIEDNVVTPYLREIFQRMLAEEIAQIRAKHPR